MGPPQAFPQWSGAGAAGRAELRDEREVRRARLSRLSGRTHTLCFKGVAHGSRETSYGGGGETRKMWSHVGLEIWVVVVELLDLVLERWNIFQKLLPGVPEGHD